jgi:hypothetical protein
MLLLLAGARLERKWPCHAAREPFVNHEQQMNGAVRHG